MEFKCLQQFSENSVSNVVHLFIKFLLVIKKAFTNFNLYSLIDIQFVVWLA